MEGPEEPGKEESDPRSWKTRSKLWDWRVVGLKHSHKLNVALPAKLSWNVPPSFPRSVARKPLSKKFDIFRPDTARMRLRSRPTKQPANNLAPQPARTSQPWHTSSLCKDVVYLF